MFLVSWKKAMTGKALMSDVKRPAEGDLFATPTVFCTVVLFIVVLNWRRSD
jgi:hypothetical protein